VRELGGQRMLVPLVVELTPRQIAIFEVRRAIVRAAKTGRV
jgi:hypothetical protein